MRDLSVGLSYQASNGSAISAYGMYKTPLTLYVGSHFGGSVANADWMENKTDIYKRFTIYCIKPKFNIETGAYIYINFLQCN